MSEKRFICGLGFPINSDDPIRIITDREKDKDYFKFSDICKIMNEQQATISALKEENEQLRQILKDIVGVTDETYTKNKNIYKVTVVFDGKMYNQIRRCLNE